MANRNLGSLTIDLIAKTGGFVAGMDQAARTAASSANKIKKTVGDALSVIGVGLAASATAVAAWTTSTINAAYEIDRLSTLANTGADTFQIWAIGARTVGIEQEKLADILKDTQDKVGDFIQTGGGPLADFFDNIAPKVGVTAEEFRKLSGPDALQLYVSSLEKAKLSQSDMVFYLEAIASDSALLLPLLKNNGQALGELGDKASELGAILGDETIIAAKQVKDEFQTLDLVYQGLKNRIVEQLLPSLSSLTGQFSNTAEGAAKLDEISRIASTGMKLLGVAGVVVAGVFKSVGTAIGGAALVLEQLLTFDPSSAFQTAKTVFNDFNTNLASTGKAAAEIWNGTVNAVLIEPPPAPDTTRLTEGHKEAAKKVVSEYEKAQGKIKDILEGIQDDIATFGLTSSEKTVFDLMALGASDAQVETAKLALATRDWLDATLKGIEDIEQFEQERTDRYRDVISSIQEEIALMGMTIEQQEIYNNLKWAGVDAESERGKEIANNTRLLQEERKKVQEQVAVLDSVRDAGKGLFVDLVSGSKSFKDSFIDALGSIRDRLISLAAERLFDKLLGPQGSTGGGGVIANIISSIFAGNRATGGPVNSGRLYEVGENGNPELLRAANGKQYLIPGNNGNITPAGSGIGGGSNVSVVVNINNGIPTTQTQNGSERDGRELAQMIEGVCTRWALKQSKNGGFFSPTGAAR